MKIVRIRAMALGDEECICNETVVEVAVSALLPGLDFLLVGLELGVVESGEKIFWVDADGLGAFLTEAEGCYREGFDAVGLDASTGIDDVVEFLHHFVYVIGVAVAGYEAAVKNLQASVEHPCTSCTLGMTGEIFLEDTKKRVTLLPTKMLHLLADDIGFVLVVGNC